MLNEKEAGLAGTLLFIKEVLETLPIAIHGVKVIKDYTLSTDLLRRVQEAEEMINKELEVLYGQTYFPKS